MKKQQLRIIGGSFRSRKVSLAGNPSIRPTSDRIRETLFNWLQAEITGAHCLELYAGSGILSLEALSRGAAHVTLLDSDRDTVKHLEKIFSKFLAPDASSQSTGRSKQQGQAEIMPDPHRASKARGSSGSNYQLVHGQALKWLGTQQGRQFDLILLDPPFGTDEILLVLDAIRLGGHASNLVYVESSKPIEKLVTDDWLIHKSSQAGKVHFGLLKVN